MLSVLILTLNEEINLPRCLKSVAWADDILVLDSFSTDATLAIAKDHGARVLQNHFVNFAEQRNFGLLHGNFKYPWILHLDADEEVSPELRDELLAVVQSGDKDAYQLASKMMFQGHWLKHSGLYPWHQVRVGKREALTFIQVGHGQRENLNPARIGTLTNPLIHHSFAKGIHDWVEKHNRYSTAEARHFVDTIGKQPLDRMGLISTDPVRRKRALKHLFSFMPCRPLLRFLYMYFFRLGLLDGISGYHYCRLLSFYESMIVIKIRELQAKQHQSC
ncbi:MAG: glycosyltransferase family 2 protein [Verrucomicrobiota bacterium]